MICKSCAGEGVKIIDGKSYPSDCSSCVAESLIRHANNPMGILTPEGAKNLCGCLSNNHKGGNNPKASYQFKNVMKNHRKQVKKEQKEKSERVFYEDKQKQEAIDYYQKRIIELKELDKNGKEWILKDNDEEIITDEF